MNRIGRFPLVSRDEILIAYRPGSPPSEGAFRTLREHGLVSAGLGLRVRRGNRLSGQLRVYSALNIDSALLARHDRKKEAKELAQKAQKQESRWETRLQKLVQELDVTDLEEIRRLRNRLFHVLVPWAEAVEKARKSTKILDEWLTEEVGVLADISEEWASLQLSEDPEDTVEVQPFLARAAALGIGDYAVLRLERFGSGSLVGIFPAVAESSAIDPTLATPDAETGEYGLSSYLSRILEPVAFDEDLTTELKTRREVGDLIKIPHRKVRLAG